MEDQFTNKKAGGLDQEHIRSRYDTGVQGDDQAGRLGTEYDSEAEKAARVAGGDNSWTGTKCGTIPTGSAGGQLT